MRHVVDAAVEPATRDFNLELRRGADLDAETLGALLGTPPMMADRRVVILRDVEGWQKKARGRAELLRYLAKPAAETVLVLVQGGADPDADAELSRLALTVRCAALEPERVLRWLAHRSGQLDITLEPGAAEHLLHAVGSDLTTLDAELAKLASLAKGTALTWELVGDLVGVRHGETMYDWRDAVFEDATGRALTLLRPVLDQSGSSGLKLVPLLGSRLAGISLARAHRDKGVRGGALEGIILKSLHVVRPYGLPEWKAEAAKWARWSERWPAARLSAALHATLAADQALKSTTLTDEQALLAELVMRLGLSRAERVA
jgi:DNA polymerase-3 subunit delta